MEDNPMISLKKSLSIYAIILTVLCINSLSAKPFDYKDYFDYNKNLSGNKTALCIINDYGEGREWESAAKIEFIKLLIDEAPHILISNDTWGAYIAFRQDCLDTFKEMNIIDPLQDVFIKNGEVYNKDGQNISIQYWYLLKSLTNLFAFDKNKWELYDTGINLFYIRNKKAPMNIGINTQSFTEIARPFTVNVPYTNNDWMNHFEKLFDLDTWQQYHQQDNKKHLYSS